MKTTSWHSVSPHPFGPEGFPAAVVEEYRPVAWVRDAETAESIASATWHCFDKASWRADRRRKRIRGKKRVEASGLFSTFLGEEMEKYFGRTMLAMIPEPPRERWAVEERPDAPVNLPFAVVDDGRIVAWATTREAAEFIATVGRIAVLERREERRRRRAERLLSEARIARILAGENGGGVWGSL